LCTADFVQSIESDVVYLCLCELLILALQVCVVLALQLHLVLKVSLHAHSSSEHVITHLLSLRYSLCPNPSCMIKPHAHTPDACWLSLRFDITIIQLKLKTGSGRTLALIVTSMLKTSTWVPHMPCDDDSSNGQRGDIVMGPQFH